MDKHQRGPENTSSEAALPTAADAAKLRRKGKIQEFMAERSDELPVWIRAPKRGHERYTGLCRSKLYELADRGLIRAVSLRNPGAVKGTKLFHLKSILDYIERCESDANGNAQT